MNNMKNKILSLLVLLLTLATGTTRAYEVQIGEGTSSTGYHPFYTLYNYSISESLYLASELTEAGVEAGPITSLSWYATNEKGYAQQGISIWMANVSDTELTTSSHLATGMTQVYTNGSMTPVIGWNEFQCNGDFSWDGTSNLLILVQRNNGEWNSTVSWQATSGLSFNCMAYRYQDSGAYDVTASNTMYISTTRPNIIIKGEAGGGLEVTTVPEEGDAFTEATFTMPANNVKVTYALARDMEVDVNAETNADSYYVIKRNNVFGYLYPDDVTLTVTDVIDAENPVVMTAGTDYTTTMQKKDEEGEWTDVTELSVGTFRYAIKGKGGYTGTIYSAPIVLKEAYEVEVAANSYATYYQKDALTLETEEEEATIYTIASIEGDKAILSEPIDAAPAETPLLIFNSKDEDRKIILLSTNEPNLALTVAPEFQGTLRAQDMDGSSDAVDYYVCNKHDFVWVKSDGTIAANRCWIELNYATARALQIVFSGDATGLKAIDNSQFTIDNGDYYDLNGRKVNQPKRKGVYIQNGRKVIVK